MASRTAYPLMSNWSAICHTENVQDCEACEINPDYIQAIITQCHASQPFQTLTLQKKKLYNV
jgi:hypothetical protein